MEKAKCNECGGAGIDYEQLVKAQAKGIAAMQYLGSYWGKNKLRVWRIEEIKQPFWRRVINKLRGK